MNRKDSSCQARYSYRAIRMRKQNFRANKFNVFFSGENLTELTRASHFENAAEISKRSDAKL